MASFGGGIGTKLGGFVTNPLLEQIFVWQVLQQLSSALLSSVVAGIQEDSFRANPSAAISADQAVDAFIKSHLSQADAAAEARLSGIDDRRFGILTDNAGEPPGLDFLTFAFRRGIIPESGAGADSISLEQAIRESRLKNKWIDVIKRMQFVPVPTSEAVDAWVQNQIPEAQARAILYQNGINDADATILFHTRGRPPGPGELIEMARRGKIPVKGVGPTVTSLEQGIYESAAKDKWEKVYEALMEYWPPPRTVTALLRAGSLTDAEALALFKGAGLSEHLAGVYVANAHHQRAAATRELVKGDVMTLYAEGVFSRPETIAHLETLGYDGPTAEFEIEAVDFRRVKGLIDKAVSRVHTLYVAHKIDAQAAMSDLDGLGLAAAPRDELLKVWALERADNVSVLTAAEVVHLAKLQVMTEDEALTWLVEHGFDALDAWYRLAVGLGAVPQTPKPA